jgi:hypothetical protein
LYCRKKHAIDFGKLEADGNSGTLAQDDPEKISSFRRVDLLPSAKPVTHNVRRGREGNAAEDVWRWPLSKLEFYLCKLQLWKKLIVLDKNLLNCIVPTRMSPIV